MRARAPPRRSCPRTPCSIPCFFPPARRAREGRGGATSGLAGRFGRPSVERLRLTVDEDLLGDPQNVVYEPIKYEAARQVQEGPREEDRHDQHHALLRLHLRIGRV